MTEMDKKDVKAWLGRLEKAVSSLEHGLEKSRRAKELHFKIADKISVLTQDRQSLAEKLDQQAGINKRLEMANQDIAQRLTNAMGNIREVLDAG